MFIAAIVSAIMLAIKIVGLITALILGFDLIRKFPAIDRLMDQHTYLSCLIAGALLGITYGAGILLKDMEFVGENYKIYLILFLSLAHGLVEETLIFALFGADIATILIIRVGIALIAVFWLYFFKKYILPKFKVSHDRGK